MSSTSAAEGCRLKNKFFKAAPLRSGFTAHGDFCERGGVFSTSSEGVPENGASSAGKKTTPLRRKFAQRGVSPQRGANRHPSAAEYRFTRISARGVCDFCFLYTLENMALAVKKMEPLRKKFPQRGLPPQRGACLRQIWALSGPRFGACF